MIFDSFPSLEKAMTFAREIKRRYRLDVEVFTDSKSAHWHDWFPGVQVPPVVHVDRTEIDTEREIEELVEEFGGVFIGT